MKFTIGVEYACFHFYKVFIKDMKCTLFMFLYVSTCDGFTNDVFFYWDFEYKALAHC